MSFKAVILWTDVVLWTMLLGLGLYVVVVRRDAALRATMREFVFAHLRGAGQHVVVDGVGQPALSPCLA